jgi:hypothetical protein
LLEEVDVEEHKIVRDAYVFGYPLVTMDMTPAEGWSFRTVVLDQDLVLTPDEGDALITEDSLGNTFDRVGGAFRNCRP